MSRAEGLYPKIAAVQRNIKPVVLAKADDDAFLFAPAPEVINRVREQVNYQRLVPLPSLVDLPARFEASDGRVLSRGLVRVKFVDSESGEFETSTWAGEAITGPETADRAVSWLTTSALKSFYLHTFVIPLVERPATINDEQLRGVVSAQSRNRLSDRQLFDLIEANLDLRLEKLTEIPVEGLIRVLEAINSAGNDGRGPLPGKDDDDA